MCTQPVVPTVKQRPNMAQALALLRRLALLPRPHARLVPCAECLHASKTPPAAPALALKPPSLYPWRGAIAGSTRPVAPAYPALWPLPCRIQLPLGAECARRPSLWPHCPLVPTVSLCLHVLRELEDIEGRLCGRSALFGPSLAAVCGLFGPRAAYSPFPP